MSKNNESTKARKRRKSTGIGYIAGSVVLGGAAFFVIPKAMRYASSYVSKRVSQHEPLDDSDPKLIKKSEYTGELLQSKKTTVSDTEKSKDDLSDEPQDSVTEKKNEV